LDEALAAYEKGQLLEYFMPEPNYQDANAWWSWRLDHWGTKWDVYDTSNSWMWDNPPELELSFSTAWGPPLRAYDAAVARHGFKVTAYYNEFGYGFCGEYVPNEKDIYIEYEKGTKIPEDLDEIFEISEALAKRDEGEHPHAVKRYVRTVDLSEHRVLPRLRWSRLSGQIFRVDKWSLCRG
jgi:hypothetical protein